MCACRGASASEQDLRTPGGCFLGQGLCRLPGSALSLPGELPTALWGEGVGGRSDPWQSRAGSFCSQEGSGLLTAPAHPQGISKGLFQEEGVGRGYLERKVLPLVFNLMLGGV